MGDRGAGREGGKGELSEWKGAGKGVSDLEKVIESMLCFAGEEGR